MSPSFAVHQPATAELAGRLQAWQYTVLHSAQAPAQCKADSHLGTEYLMVEVVRKPVVAAAAAIETLDQEFEPDDMVGNLYSQQKVCGLAERECMSVGHTLLAQLEGKKATNDFDAAMVALDVGVSAAQLLDWASLPQLELWVALSLETRSLS